MSAYFIYFEIAMGSHNLSFMFFNLSPTSICFYLFICFNQNLNLFLYVVSFDTINLCTCQ